MGVLGLLVLCLQGNPDDRLKSFSREVGTGFRCERPLPNLYMATDLSETEAAALRVSLEEIMSTIGSQAFPPTLKSPLTIIVFKDSESLTLFAGRHPEERLRAPGSFDPVHRRLLGMSALVSAYAPTVLTTLLVKDFVGSELVPVWLISGLSLLGEGGKEITVDSRIALLKNEWLREPNPTLPGLIRMNLEAFQAEDRQSLHLSLSREWLRFLSKRGLLKNFMMEFRKTLKADATGQKALEGVLATTLDKVENDWEAYIRSLSWMDPREFGKKAKELFGDQAFVAFDDDLLLAVAGNADEKVIKECLLEARKVRRPLLRALGLKASYLPLTGYFFKDHDSFKAHVRASSPDEKDVSLAGVYLSKARTILCDAADGPRVLIHELSHSLLMDEMGHLPAWLEEGLASLYEVSEAGPNGIRALSGESLKRVAQAQSAGRIPRFEDFLDPRWKGFWESDRIDLSYSMSRALMLYLQETGHLPELTRNVKLLVRTAPQLDPSCSRTLEKSAGIKLEDLFRNFGAWVAESAKKP